MKRKKPLPHSAMAKRRHKRFIGLTIFLVLFMGYLFFTLWRIQTVDGAELNRMSSEWRVNRMSHGSTVTPQRGWIMDRNMQTLAMSQSVFNVALDVSMLAYRENVSINRGGANRRMWMDEALTALHEELDIPMETLRAMFIWNAADNAWRPDFHDNWRIVARQVPAGIAIPLRDRFTDINLEEVSLRTYPDPTFAPQVIGFMHGVNNDNQWGLELQFHNLLSGAAGRTFREFDANNTLTRGEIPVQHGMTIVTTLDSDIQRLTQQTVDAVFRDIQTDAVGMIVMRPDTGEIIAMAQAPTFSLAEPFNVELFSDPSIYALWEYKTAQERQNARDYMWRNYHTIHTFEPGSIFKPIVVAAALEEGIIQPHDTFFCEGIITVGNVQIRCFGGHAHHTVNVSQILSQSCNVGTIQIMQRLGRDEFYRYRGYFGYGERTGIDLPGEAAVSSPYVMYPLHMLGPVQLATSSIGQGFNATSIQSITSFAALINGGNVMRPFIVSHVIDENGVVVQETRPQVIRRAISQETSDWMRTELEQTILDPQATGRNTRITGHSIGGKTGTAERGADRDEVSIAYWIYTPVENPEFIIFIVAENVEQGRTAGNTLAPVLRSFLQELIIMRNMPPSEGPYLEYDTSPVIPVHPMLDFTGHRVSDAVRNLVNLEIGFQIVGGGTVITHTFPGPDNTRPLPWTIPVQIHTDPATAIPGGMTVMPDVVGLYGDIASQFVRDATFIPMWFGGTTELANYVVYRQYPAPGTVVEQGIQTILRMRRR
ncbi:MAG: penicillin-binding protein 2 [Defluviitaleaceae bacterium]|nr:penicillin-binding protein 2 [Defluviitaleaceae bacterium]